MKKSFLDLSSELLLATKIGKQAEEFVQEIARLNLSQLAKELKEDADKKAFWINLYNAFIQLILKENSLLQKDPQSLFTEKRIVVGGKPISFDLIEHGLLRRSQFKYGLGYLKNPFLGSFEKQFRVNQRDFRIHFALNCGAKSCPPIAFYEAQRLDRQLNEASASFLENESTYNPEKNELLTSRLFYWFSGDFGGKKGIIEIHSKWGILPEKMKPRILYKKYDWSLEMNKFVS